MATNRRQQIRLSPDEQAAFFRERKKAALAMIRGRCKILDDEASVRAAFAARAGTPANASAVQPGALASAPKCVVLRIVPEKVVSWDHRKLSGRY